jgi:hypothetical protein
MYEEHADFLRESSSFIFKGEATTKWVMGINSETKPE